LKKTSLTLLLIAALFLLLSILLSSCNNSGSPLNLTEEDFYFCTAEGEKYIPTQGKSGSLYSNLSVLKSETTEVYYCKNGLTAGDSASKIFESFNLKDTAWAFEIIYSYDFMDENSSSEWAAIEKELSKKVYSVKSKKEYTDLHSAKELVENEAAIIGDNRLDISLKLTAVQIGDNFYLGNELPAVKQRTEIYKKYGADSTDSDDTISEKIGKKKYNEFKDEIDKFDREIDYKGTYILGITIQNQKIKNIWSDIKNN
jgi:hypothetical protein